MKEYKFKFGDEVIVVTGDQWSQKGWIGKVVQTGDPCVVEYEGEHRLYINEEQLALYKLEPCTEPIIYVGRKSKFDPWAKAVFNQERDRNPNRFWAKTYEELEPEGKNYWRKKGEQYYVKK